VANGGPHVFASAVLRVDQYYSLGGHRRISPPGGEVAPKEHLPGRHLVHLGGINSEWGTWQASAPAATWSALAAAVKASGVPLAELVRRGPAASTSATPQPSVNDVLSTPRPRSGLPDREPYPGIVCSGTGCWQPDTPRRLVLCATWPRPPRARRP